MDPISVKVLNYSDGKLIVWSVNVQPGFGPGRLCGAWSDAAAVADDLLGDQWVLVLPAAREHVPDVRGLTRLDPVATLDAIGAEFAAMVAINKASRTPLGKPRARLQPIPMPDPFDADLLPTSALGVDSANPAIVTAIVGAHYVASLAQSWEKVEAVRHAREYLHGGYAAARPFPARSEVLTNATMTA